MEQNQNSLEALKIQLINSLKGLKEHEELLLSVDTNQEEQIKNENDFKNELDSALKSLEQVPKSFTLASNQISSVYSIAQDLSFRINVIDEALSRCQSAAKHVQMFADLFECLNTIEDAIQSKNIEQCCQIISKLIAIPKNLLSKEDNEKIEKYRQTTLDILKRQMKDEQDPALIFSYYEKCGAQVQGVKEYTNIQFQQITQDENPKYMKLHQMNASSFEDKQEAPHIRVFVEYLNGICLHINESRATIKEPGQFSVFIRLLLQLADQPINQLIQEFARYRSVEYLCGEIKSNEFGYSCLVCDEMASISKQYSQFQKFISNLVKPGLQTQFFKNYSFDKETNQSTGLAINTESERQLRLLLSEYTMLTSNFANTVIQEDMLAKLNFQKNQETMDTISDVFFFFNEILTRTFRANSASTAVSVCNLISALVRTLFETLKEQDQNPYKFREINGLFGTLWNASELTNVHILKLVDTFEKSNKHFTGDDSEIIKSTIIEYKSFSDELRQRMTKYLEKAMSNLTPYFENLLNIFRQSWTRDTPENPINVEMEMSLESDFSVTYEKFFVNYFKTLNKTNKEQLILAIARRFAQRFEDLIKKKRFDQKGAVLLDRLVKFFIKTMIEAPFNRLKQIAFIMTRESKDEIQEAFGDNPPCEWTLTREETDHFADLKLGWKN